MYEEGMRMPFIMRYQKMVKTGISNSWLINNTDFAVTMLELAGAKRSSYMQGHRFAGPRGNRDQANNRDGNRDCDRPEQTIV